MIGGFLLNTCP